MLIVSNFVTKIVLHFKNIIIIVIIIIIIISIIIIIIIESWACTRL